LGRVAKPGKSPLKTASTFAGVCQRNTLMLLGFSNPAGVAIISLSQIRAVSGGGLIPQAQARLGQEPSATVRLPARKSMSRLRLRLS
jgi:hypothetical protein